jgi:hypothetical protein
VKKSREEGFAALLSDLATTINVNERAGIGGVGFSVFGYYAFETTNKYFIQ